MLIRSRMGVSADGFVATADGVPAFLVMPDFVPGHSHGYTAFIERCDAVLMGRSTFLPALGAPTWPWAGLEVFVLTSRPLPPETHRAWSPSRAARLAPLSGCATEGPTETCTW